MQEGLTQMCAKILFSALSSDFAAKAMRFWRWPWVVTLVVVGIGTIFWIKRISPPRLIPL